MTKLKIDNSSYKVGVNEIEGLADAMRNALAPVSEFLKGKVYWDDCTVEPTEYKSRDGFIPYTDNCGGFEISLVIPKCESCEFDFLEFGECDECGKETDSDGHLMQCGYEGQECASDNEGHLDAHLRVWLKFEGLSDDGTMEFYLTCHGGNGDAPYFRTKYSVDIFETEFTAKSIAGVSRQAKIAVAKLLKKIG
jgi:hypothetical protein